MCAVTRIRTFTHHGLRTHVRMLRAFLRACGALMLRAPLARLSAPARGRGAFGAAYTAFRTPFFASELSGPFSGLSCVRWYLAAKSVWKKVRFRCELKQLLVHSVPFVLRTSVRVVSDAPIMCARACQVANSPATQSALRATQEPHAFASRAHQVACLRRVVGSASRLGASVLAFGCRLCALF